MADKIKVLIVDDSAVVRNALADILSSDKNFEIIGSATDPFMAAEILKTKVPDVITLDIEMPRMDGLTFLYKIMTQHPIPVVICSSLSEKNTASGIKALEYGAVDIITKPKMGVKKFIEEAQIQICDTVKAASRVNVKKLNQVIKSSKKLTADAVLPPMANRAMLQTTEKIIAVGASTGGTEALKVFLEQLPADSPAIVIVQHMPENFTTSFAQRLNSLCKVEVKEAEHNDALLRGRVLIAPGNKHTVVKRSGAKYFVEVKDGPLVCRHRPSVDVLFRSVANFAGANAVGVIMTGMGDDGSKGMFEMKQAGAYNIAQDEASCVVYGMPKEAVELGGVNKTLPLDDIAREILKVVCS